MMNRQVIRKLAIAKRMERDALAELIPPRERAHLAVISREMHAMIKENIGMNPSDLAEVMATFMEVREIFSEESPTCDNTSPENKPDAENTDTEKGGPGRTQGSAHTRKVDIS